MKWTMLTILITLFSHDINKIAMINRLKKEAEKAYVAKNYKEAAGIYQTLVDSLGQNDEALLMNLSHCYFNLRDTTNALSAYKKLTQSENPSFRSTAFQQMGVLDSQSNRYADAEEDFRNSLRSKPGNDEARYDYELLKKKLRNQEKNQSNPQKDQKNDQNKQDKDKQNKQQQDQQKQDKKNNQQNQDQQKQQQNQQQNEDQKKQQDKNKDKKQEARQAEQQNENQDKNRDKQQLLKNDKQEVQKISIDKARMILEAMKNSEEQYLQQLQHKATKKPDSDKPDW